MAVLFIYLSICDFEEKKMTAQYYDFLDYFRSRIYSPMNRRTKYIYVCYTFFLKQLHSFIKKRVAFVNDKACITHIKHKAARTSRYDVMCVSVCVCVSLRRHARPTTYNV